MSASSHVLVLGRPFGSLLVQPPRFRGRVLLVGDAAHDVDGLVSTNRILVRCPLAGSLCSTAFGHGVLLLSSLDFSD